MQADGADTGETRRDGAVGAGPGGAAGPELTPTRIRPLRVEAGESATRVREEPVQWGHGDHQELARGESIGRYVVLDRLGAGAMGVVYCAFDPELDRKVAIKLLKPEAGGGSVSASSDARARLLREAQALARLSHPNVVAVHDGGGDGGGGGGGMEVLGGGTASPPSLSNLLLKQSLPAARPRSPPPPTAATSPTNGFAMARPFAF